MKKTAAERNRRREGKVEKQKSRLKEGKNNIKDRRYPTPNKNVERTKIIKLKWHVKLNTEIWTKLKLKLIKKNIENFFKKSSVSNKNPTTVSVINYIKKRHYWKIKRRSLHFRLWENRSFVNCQRLFGYPNSPWPLTAERQMNTLVRG